MTLIDTAGHGMFEMTVRVRSCPRLVFGCGGSSWSILSIFSISVRNDMVLPGVSEIFNTWSNIRNQKWTRFRSRLRQDSGSGVKNIGPGSGVKNMWKTWPGSGVTFQISAVAGVCVVISSVKTWVSFGWIDDGDRSLNRSPILKFERLPDPDSKIWNRSGVGVWKSESGHLCWKP